MGFTIFGAIGGMIVDDKDLGLFFMGFLKYGENLNFE
jgi:hypothetical protein